MTDFPHEINEAHERFMAAGLHDVGGDHDPKFCESCANEADDQRLEVTRPRQLVLALGRECE